MQTSEELRRWHKIDGLQGSFDAGASSKSGDDLRGTVFEPPQERASRRTSCRNPRSARC